MAPSVNISRLIVDRKIDAVFVSFVIGKEKSSPVYPVLGYVANPPSQCLRPWSLVIYLGIRSVSKHTESALSEHIGSLRRRPDTSSDRALQVYAMLNKR